jgi:signal transduction histidine kinase
VRGAHLLAGAVLATLVSVAALNGGLGAPALIYLPAVPVLVTLLVGLRGGVVWGAVTVVCIVAFGVIDAAGVALPVELSEQAMSFLSWTCQIGVLALCLLLIGNYERAAELQVSQLEAVNIEIKSSRDRAEAASEAKGRFLANMSHEVRTPLHGIMGMIALLLETRLDDEQRSHCETVARSGDGLLSVINDILDFSKIEAGKLELELTGFSIGAVVNDTVQLFSERALSKGLKLELELDPDLPKASVGDPNRLRQVLESNRVGRSGRIDLDLDRGIRATLSPCVFPSSSSSSSSPSRSFCTRAPSRCRR